MRKGSPTPVHVRIVDNEGKPTQIMVRLLEDMRKDFLPKLPEYDGEEKTYQIKVTEEGAEWVQT